MIIWWIQWLWCVVCSASQLQRSQLCTWSCASVVVSSSLLWRSLVWWEAQTVWEGRMNHKRNVNYWSNYSGGFIWICQGACPKVQLREDDLPQVLCSPPCSLDQESQTPFVAVCLRCLPCLQPFSIETSAQTTSTSCCWEQVVYYWYVNIPKLNGASSFSHPICSLRHPC